MAVQLTPRKLRKFNMLIAALQLLCGFAIMFLTRPTTTTRKLPLVTNFVRDSRPGQAGFFEAESKKQLDVPVGIYAGIFLLLSGMHHLLVALPGINGWYNSLLAINMQPMRWIEYSISASFMRVLVAQLSGVTDLHLIVAIFGLTMTTMTFGWLMESMNGRKLTTYKIVGDDEHPVEESANLDGHVQQASMYSNKATDKVDFTPFWLGFIPHAIAWSIVGCYFFVSLRRGSPPAFVYAIIIIVFLLDLTFAINQWLQFKQASRFVGFARAEFFYIILSLTSKQLLAWINFGGTNRLGE